MGTRIPIVAAAALLALTAAAPAVASEYGGFNGVVKLAFDQSDTLAQVATAEPDSNGLVNVDLYAVIDGVAPVSYQGEGLVSVGGFELKLIVEGGGQIVAQEIPGKALNMAKETGECLVGVYPAIDLVRGRATLVHWKVMFVGKPKDVVFRLEEGWPPSCDTVEGCPGTGSACVYVGSSESLAGLIFSAGWAPAFLNWSGEADTSPRLGKPAWSEMGLFD